MAGVRTRRASFWFLAALVAALLAVWLLLSQEEGNLQVDVDRVGVDLSLEEVHLVQGEGGELQWELTADQATYVKDQSLARLVNPRFTFFPGQGNQTVNQNVNQTVRVEAPFGEVEQARDRVSLWPEVTASFGDYVFQSQRLDYRGSDQNVVFSGDVSVTRPGMELDSEQASLALDTRRITASGNVRVVLSQESDYE